MSDESVVDPSLFDYKREHVLPQRDEFDDAAKDGSPSREAGRRYMRVLGEYAGKVYDSPHAPGSASVNPTAHDSATRQAAQAELDWIDTEKSRVMDYFGGILAAEE